MQNVLERFSNAFIVSAFVPALGFILTAMIIFAPIVPKSVTQRIPITFEPPTTGALFLFVFTLVLGYTLNNLNDYFLQLTEGYYLLERFPVFRKRQEHKASRWKKRITLIQKLIVALQDKDSEQEQDEVEDIYEESEEVGNDDEVEEEYEDEQITPTQIKIRQLEAKLYSRQALYNQIYPTDLEAVLPTRFGNVLRTSESYPRSRYGIDSITIWSRLVYVISPEYDRRIIQSYQGVSFLVACMILALLMGLLCLLASIYQIITWRYAITATGEATEILYFIPVIATERMQMIYLQRGGLYLVGALFSSGIAAFFYFASIPMAIEFGNMIRSAYDLFRFQLLDELKLEKPKTREEEIIQWKLISSFMAIGDPEKGKLKMKYQLETVARKDSSVSQTSSSHSNSDEGS